MSEKLTLTVKGLKKDFRSGGTTLNPKKMRALNDVSLNLESGKALAIVGESGSGKSTIAKIITGIHDPTGGEIELNGKNVVKLKGDDKRKFRQKVQMVFQDPFASLNPTHTIRHHIERPLKIHRKLKGDALEAEVLRVLTEVGLTPAKATADKYPHELSGGQRQRVNIARGMAAGAEIILADEPTSMLDVSIRIGVLNLMSDMKDKHDIGFMYITHDIATARYFAEQTAVMYVGHMVEWGDTETITQAPKHPYTQLLISAVPDPSKRIDAPLQGGERGEIPVWYPDSVGCPFAERCLSATDHCRKEMPGVTQLADNHFTRCHLYS
ncbi:ABC transporter ATP-binding protein [Salinibius halmophilus]|uniref:ABC transporter ATP-binding protein n=1 Tax=Salinibius halmophilus TaxID=1853216 RepID=UPI000E664DEA|nr:ABC transporter ATP-binding protein [Salinibius halmophilus]